MEMQETAEGAVPPQQEGPSMTFFQRLAGVFFEPTKTFQDINLKPTWLVIFLILAVLVGAFSYLARSRVDIGLVTRKTLESLPIHMSEEQINQAVERAEQQNQNQSLASKILSAVSAPVSVLITYLILAAIFLATFLLAGAHLKFKKAFAVTMWGAAPPAIVQQILSMIILFIKDPGTIDVTEGVVTSNLGPLVDAKTHAVLNSVASSIDIFSIWHIALLSIGFAAISDKKLTPKKAAVGIVVLWAVYVLAKAGYRAIIS
jgi:hypothetical protein